jgi:3-dehydroquinate synthase|tara:strand:- start:2074 stop:3159 length:1086 start_codon:yes stop_codon:yes gene_type:complete
LIDQETLQVELGERTYPIIIGSEFFKNGFIFDEWVSGKDCLIVTNEVVAPLYLESLVSQLKNKNVVSLILPDGESNKTLTIWSQIIDKLVAMKASRDTTVIALGGGVIGDITGFAAASYMRGIPYIQVPTTLLSQVDSSVGGKTGINHIQGKNLVGAFHQPKLVLIDIDTLNTLPKRELISGLAEVIKYGAIADYNFFCWLEKQMEQLLNRDPEILIKAILKSCSIKAQVVGDDEFENGRRAILNFGHTFGHAIENIKGYGEILHGEAIAIGMVLAAEISSLNQPDINRLEALIMSAGLPHKIDSINVDAMYEVMLMDKKVKANKLRYVLLRSLGEAFIDEDVSAENVRDVITNRVSGLNV